MLGLVVDLICQAGFHDLAAVHDVHTAAGAGYNAQVVGDEDNARTGLFLELLDKLDDLGLDGHVQSGGGLIGNDELGVAGQGDGDDHTLAHTAGQLMRVLLEAFLRRGNAHLGEQFHCLLV